MTRICAHLPGRGYVERFSGRGIESELVCLACDRDAAAPTRDATAEQLVEIRREQAARYDGDPGLIELPGELALEVDEVSIECPELADLQPLGTADRSLWLGVTANGRVIELDLDRHRTRTIAEVGLDRSLALHVARAGRYAAVVENRGFGGVVIDLASGRELRRIHRNHDGFVFSFAFAALGGRELAIFAPTFERIDMVDVVTNELLTPRTAGDGGQHFRDGGHGRMHVSPGAALIADAGDVTDAWSLERWLSNPWEPEGGRSLRQVAMRTEWSAAVCWIDDARLAVIGHGDLMPRAVEIIDARTGELVKWFLGPEQNSELVFDRVLVALGPETSIWDIERSGCLAKTEDYRFVAHHPGAKQLVTMPSEGTVAVARLRGLDAGAAWATDHVRAVAASIDDPEAQLGILGDALDDAGCTDDELLSHCRNPGPHGRRCWALDRLARR